MRIKDDIAAGSGLCTLAQAVRCASTGRTTGSRAVTGRRVPADRGNSRGSRGGGAGGRSGGGGSASTSASTSAHGLAVDGQARAAAIRATFARIEGLTRVEPACAGARGGVAGGENNKVAGWVGVAVVPA
jgi:hypothetical protein